MDSETQKRCANMCFRALTLLLLITACILAMIPGWSAQSDLRYFKDYYDHRVALSNAYEELKARPHWQELVESAAKELRPLDNRTLIQINYDYDSVRTQAEKADALVVSHLYDEAAARYRAIAPDVPPSGAKVFISIAPLAEDLFVDVREALHKITADNNRAVLRALTAPDSESRLAVSRYLRQLNRIEKYERTPSGKLKESVRPQVFSEPMNLLTLSDLHTLASVELINLESLQKNLEASQVTIPWLKETAQVTTAIPLIAIAICIVQSYYLVMVKHLANASGFPCAGTIFGAGNQDGSTQILFAFILCLPAIALGILSATGYKEDQTIWIVWICAGFEILLTLFSVRWSLVFPDHAPAVVTSSAI